MKYKVKDMKAQFKDDYEIFAYVRTKEEADECIKNITKYGRGAPCQILEWEDGVTLFHTEFKYIILKKNMIVKKKTE